MMDSLDLTKLDVKPRAQDGVEMALIDPAGNRTGAFLRVRGLDSQAYRERFEDQQRGRLERAGRKQSQDEKNAEFWELQGVLVCGWRPKLVIAPTDQAPLEYSHENAVRLLREHPFIWEQVYAFSQERANFLPGSASSSSAT